jgi:uncharacterized protein (TIGR03663 family)
LTTASPKIRWAIFFALALLALAVRWPQLDVRPMHTDEAINGYLTGGLLTGEAFHYDPQDRHGPALYLLAVPVAKMCGAHNLASLTENELRLSTVITGSAMILLFGFGVELFGFIACLTAALLFAFAPLPVYYNRYFIHETLFVAATFGWLLSGWRMLETKSLWAGALAGFCAALMLACKETAVIHFFAVALTGAIGWAFLPRTNFLKSKAIPVALLVFLGTVILLFSWFGQNWAGLTDLFHAAPRFFARAGGEGHAKPFSYYLELLDTSLVLFPLTLAGVYIAIWESIQGDRKPYLLLALYGLVTFVAYSTIPYKTPWLALNLWLPLALINGLGVAGIWALIKKPIGHWLAGLACVGFLAVLGLATKALVFDKPADEKNPFAYAHTGEDILRLPERLNELAQQSKNPQPRLAVIAADAWPLPWYLRKFSNVGYWQPGTETGAANFFITPTDVSGALAVQLKDYRPEFFGVRPNVLLILWTPAETLHAHE